MVCGPKWSFYSWIVILDCCDRLYTGYVSRVELHVQRRLCPIFVRNVGSHDIHECFRGLTSSQRTPEKWGVTYTIHQPGRARAAGRVVASLGRVVACIVAQPAISWLTMCAPACPLSAPACPLRAPTCYAPRPISQAMPFKPCVTIQLAVL